MDRYSVIEDKNPREIVLLRGRGCAYKKCTFCDYYSDSSPDCEENYQINCEALSHITGIYGDVEIINSGSVFELDDATIAKIIEVCKAKAVKIIHFEAHYIYNNLIDRLRETFRDFTLKMKLGVESFDYNFREDILKKGINESDPAIISQNFEEANFLFGVTGQTYESMKNDLELGLKYFERICVNIMCPNTTDIQPDNEVIGVFLDRLYPKYKDNPRVDILINNTDFGVGD